MLNKSVLILCVLTLSLVGCTSLKKVTGQTNDTILPGTREDVLPPDQTTARDPSITGGQPAPGTGIQQQTLAQPGMPQQPPMAAQPGTPLQSHAGTVVTCDPLVESCPGMTPPPSTKPVSVAKAPAGKVIVPPKTKTAVTTTAKAATATAPQAGAAATTPTAPAVETVGTDPMKPQLKPVKKKKKKLVLKPKATAPAAPDATAPADATQAPPPLVPPDTKTQ